jgi:hypothetical protein
MKRSLARRRCLDQLALIAALIGPAACGASNDDSPVWNRPPTGVSGSGSRAGAGGAAGHAAGGASEVCNGIDDNANRRIDEGCQCRSGQQQSCYTGPVSTRNKGMCKDGKQVCTGSGEFGAWGDCTGSVVPSATVQCGDAASASAGGAGGEASAGPAAGAGGGPSIEICDDKRDNNGDGNVDCNDPQCAGQAACSSPGGSSGAGGSGGQMGIEICADRKDNNGDGHVDCNDPQCKDQWPCYSPGGSGGSGWGGAGGGSPYIENCADGFDNNGDTLVDCDDPQCTSTPACLGLGGSGGGGMGTEICNDGFDDDGNGLADCDDPQCASFPTCGTLAGCSPQPEICDGKDNNCNGLIDDGDACKGVGEPCLPGSVQTCDCYCGVQRKCQSDGTWGPCKVNSSFDCHIAPVYSHDQCGGGRCNEGACIYAFYTQCVGHTDCGAGQVCDMGVCVKDHYHLNKQCD